MEAICTSLVAVREGPSAPSAEGPCPVCGRLASDFEDYWQAQYFRAQHQRAVEREVPLKKEIKQLKARVRLLQRRLFGRSPEMASVVDAVAIPGDDPSPRRPRGQQPGRGSPRKRDYTHLPEVEEIHDLPEEQRRCACCGQPFVSF